MSKLKTEYKGVILTKSGRTIILDNVDPKDAEAMGLSEYFTNEKPKKKSKKKEESDFISI